MTMVVLMSNVRARSLAVLLCAILSLRDVAGFGLGTSLGANSGFLAHGIPHGSSSTTSSTAPRCCNSNSRTAPHSSSMFFDFGNKSKGSATGKRPVAGGTVKGGKKTKIVQEVRPAAKRQQATAQRRSPAQLRNKDKLQGVFTPSQFEAFQKARREVPSGSGQAYWNKIAARVPGQSAAACKGMAETLLFEKAAGTQANYFGNYVETKETPDYVDPDAGILTRLGKIFGGSTKNSD